MAGTAERGSRPKVEAVPDPAHRADSEGSAEPSATPGPAMHAGSCPVAWCPVCLAVTAVQPLKPEVVEHLLRAGAEFFLAMRAVVDARADEVAGSGDGDEGGDGLEKIEIG
jgi:hypothetical protein